MLLTERAPALAPIKDCKRRNIAGQRLQVVVQSVADLESGLPRNATPQVGPGERLGAVSAAVAQHGAVDGVAGIGPVGADARDAAHPVRGAARLAVTALECGRAAAAAQVRDTRRPVVRHLARRRVRARRLAPLARKVGEDARRGVDA